MERFVGLRFRISPQHHHYWVNIHSNGYQRVNWNWPHNGDNEYNWHSKLRYAPVPPGVYIEIRVAGDVTELNCSNGPLNCEYVDFYNPGRTRPVYVKAQGSLTQVWQTVQ